MIPIATVIKWVVGAAVLIFVALIIGGVNQISKKEQALRREIYSEKEG